MHIDSQHPGTSPARSRRSEVSVKQESRARSPSLCSITDRHSTLKSKISAVLPSMTDAQIAPPVISPSEFKKVNAMNVVLTPMENEAERKQPG